MATSTTQVQATADKAAQAVYRQAAVKAAVKSAEVWEKSRAKGEAAAERTEATPLLNMVRDYHAARSLGATLDELTTKGVNKDMVTKCELAGAMLAKGGEMPETGERSLAHYLRGVAIAATRAGSVGVGNTSKIIEAATSCAAAVNAVLAATVAATAGDKAAKAEKSAQRKEAKAAESADPIGTGLSAMTGTATKVAELAKSGGVTEAHRVAAEALIELLTIVRLADAAK